MKLTATYPLLGIFLLLGCLADAQVQRPSFPSLQLNKLAADNFGPDAPWFLRNIPFLEIDDPEIQQIYYYRWKVYRAHIREIGPQGTTVLEFLEDVPWAREPFTDLNDSSSFHLMEGRWLRDPSVVNSLIDHLYTGGANDRHFSESLAAATEATTLVTGDPSPALRHLDTMQHIFNLWDDHFDRSRNLYWIEPLPDATEYTISSIDASGAGFTDHPSKDQNHNGFTGGFAFRPSINSYQFANALAISHLAAHAGKSQVAADYALRADRLQHAVLNQLWNPALQHFTDRYSRSTPTSKAGDFIRGRELVGYVPWLYNLPPSSTATTTSIAWQHVLDPQQLAGPFGLRTVEPSYPRYLTQYRYDASTGLPECQWNGPSWPFQTSQLLGALANFLHSSSSPGPITRDDYLHLLRQYTHQHFLTPGHPDIQEDYNPDTGAAIVGLPRSHHYLHSTYIDLVLTGLLGVRPQTGHLLELDPLLTAASNAAHPIRWFAIDRLRYHDHDISILYDADGTRYHLGRGVSIFVDRKHAIGPVPLRRVTVSLPTTTVSSPRAPSIDIAVNPGVPEGPIATASSSDSTTAPAQALDGRLWFFPETRNGWSPAPDSRLTEEWLAVDLRQPETVSAVEVYFSEDGKALAAPPSFRLQFFAGSVWTDIPRQHRIPENPIANGENRITFPSLVTQQIRILIPNTAPTQTRLIELKAFAATRSLTQLPLAPHRLK
ncbi:MAG: hypothetical protein NVS9B15_16240 [Acidobacteriaceae bacterium]